MRDWLDPEVWIPGIFHTCPGDTLALCGTAPREPQLHPLILLGGRGEGNILGTLVVYIISKSLYSLITLPFYLHSYYYAPSPLFIHRTFIIHFDTIMKLKNYCQKWFLVLSVTY